MAITINFPDNPTLNQEYIFAGKKWKYNGTGWILVAAVGFVPYTGATNNLDMGSFGITADYYSLNTSSVVASAIGMAKWNSDAGTMDIGMGYPDVIQQVGMKTYYPPVKNQTGSTITNGTVVMATGTLGVSGRILIAPAVADGSVPSRFMLGITTHDLLAGSDGLVTWFGLVRGFNTVAKAPVGETWVDGDVLWINPAVPGGMTKVEPTAPNIKVSIALVIHAGTNGIIMVRPSLGMRLTDLHDVNAFSPVTGDLIAHDGTKWINRTVGQALGFTALGDTLYAGASGAATVLPGNITTAKQFLSQTGTGTVSASPSWASITGNDVVGAALTKTDDTNVTLTLGGAPATSLLRAASITVGWTGTLAVARGGTGLSALGTANQLLRVNAGATALEYFTPSFLTAAITSINGLTAATQTFANDTNVTITSATSTHTIGWSGQLAVSRGGTGASTLTGILVGNGTSAVTAVAGTASQLLRRNAGNTAYEFFTIAGSDITGAALTKTDDTNVTLTLGGTPATSLLRAASLTLGWTGQLAVGRGGTGASTLTGVIIGNGTSAFTGVAGTASQLLRRNSGNTAYEFFTPSFAASVITSGTFGTGNYIFPANVEIGGQINSPVNAKGNSATAVTFNWNDANVQTVTMTGNATFTFSNPASGASYQIIITQDATGGRTITWPTIRWDGKTVPTLTGTANSIDIVTLTYDGSNYYGVISKNHGTP